MDVPVDICFPDRPPTKNTTPGNAPGSVMVWRDAHGRKQFLAPAGQRAFFRAAGYGQLRAQIDLLG